MALFLNVPWYDNWYITDHFLEYDKKQQKQGLESLFPMYLYEIGMYVRPTDLRMNANELINLAYMFVSDIYVTCYVIGMFSLDFVTYQTCAFVRAWTFKIAEDIVRYPRMIIKAQASFVENYLSSITSNNQQLISDYQELRDQVKLCAPKDVRPEYEFYMKCLFFLFILYVTSIVEPYLNRTSSCLCSRLFPHMVEMRSQYLYLFIKYSRIIMKK